MPKMGNLTPRTQKIIYAQSGNICAFRGCNEQLVKTTREEGVVSHIGEIAHIFGSKPGSARFKPDMSDDARDSHNNLILLCPTHHKLIDDNADDYPSEVLMEMKKEHIGHVHNIYLNVSKSITFKELRAVTSHIISVEAKPNEDYDLIPIKEKISRNGLSDEIENQIQIGLSKVRLVEGYVESHTDIDFGERLKNGFVIEYKRLSRDEGLKGDELFYGLFNFASESSPDNEVRVAALSVLTYLFEKCDIFEK